MGGWIALLLAKRHPERVAALIGIASAPDFTARRWEMFTEDQRRKIVNDGRIELPSQYADESYVYTHRLFEDGPCNFVQTEPLDLAFPVRLLHGTADPDVPYSVSQDLLQHITCPDATLTLIKDGDHRLSNQKNLSLLSRTIESIW